MISFNFPVNPVAKGRPRFSGGRAYTPQKTRDFEKLINIMAKVQHKGEPLKGALSVVIVFFIKKPKSVKREYPTVKPDVDNLCKSALDSLNGIAFDDDSQIIEINASKKYNDIGGIFISIKPYLHS